jgi:hypothetical protein
MEQGRPFGDAERVSPRLSRESLAPQTAAVHPAGRAIAAWTRPERGGFQKGVFVANRRK